MSFFLGMSCVALKASWRAEGVRVTSGSAGFISQRPLSLLLIVGSVPLVIAIVGSALLLYVLPASLSLRSYEGPDSY